MPDAAGIRIDDVHHRHLPANEGVAQFGRAGAIESERRQLARPARLEAAPLQSEHETLRSIGGDHDAVARVFALERERLRVAFDDNRVGDAFDGGARRLDIDDPACRRRIRRHSPGDAIVVTDGHAGKPGRGGADHVPTRRLQMHEIAQRRRRQRAMRIVGKKRRACRTSADAATAHALLPEKGDAKPEKNGVVPTRLSASLDLTPALSRLSSRRDYVERQPAAESRRAAAVRAPGRRRPQAAREMLRLRVAAREKRVGPVQQIFGRPELRLPSGQQRIPRADPLRARSHPRVDAATNAVAIALTSGP